MDLGKGQAFDAPVTKAPSEGTGKDWYLLLLLTLCYTLAFADSRLPLILVESIKADLGLSDTQMGIIVGPAFSVTYALATIPIARLSDRYARRYVLAAAISIWSGFTAAAGATHHFITLLLARTGLAIGESALTPAAHSLISDSFPSSLRARAIAIYSTAIAFGAVLALALGGYINDHYGWRMAMYAVGAAGLVLVALVLLTMREPERKRSVVQADAGDGATAGVRKETIKSLFRDPVIRHTIIGGTLLCLAHGAIAWVPAYMLRAFDMSASKVGAAFGASAGLAALIGILLGGFVNDWLAKRDSRHAFWCLAAVFVLGAVFKIISLLMPGWPAFLVFMFLSTLLLTFYPGPTYGMIQSRVDASSRSFASAVGLFCLQGIGISLGGFLTGLLSDSLPFADDAEGLRWALIIVALASVWSAAHYYWATRYLPRSQPEP